MFDTLVRSVEDAFIQFNLRRLFYLTFVLAVIVGGLYLFDNATDYSFFARFDKRLDALERLQEINSKGVPAELAPTYDQLVQALQQHKREPLNFAFSYAPLLKIASASLLYWIFVIVGLIQKMKGVPDWDSLVIGAFIFGATASVLALLIPTIVDPSVNAAIYATIQVISVIMLSRYGNRIQAARAAG